MTTDRVQCRKCGADLDPRQKVCPRCGELTAAGGKFHIEEEEHWRPSSRMIKIAVGVVAAIIVAVVLYSVLHVVPPEVVAEEWFTAMSSRSLGTAREHVTPKLEQSLRTRMMDLLSLSDTYYTEVDTNQARYKVAKPAYRGARHADVSIILTYPGGAPGPEVKLQMVKVGRQWKVDQVL